MGVSMNKLALILGLTIMGLNMAYAAAPSPDASAEEQAACRSDAIKFCFFKIPNGDALRACLRDKKPKLSQRCQALLTSRGN
jgi:hypothetical protein